MIEVKSIKKEVKEITSLGSLPDVDTDTEGLQRPRVKEYMEKRFGETQVTSLGTFTTAKIKAAITDLARYEGVNIGTVRRITAKLGEEENLKTIEDFFKVVCRDPEIKAFVLNHTELINDAMIYLNSPKTASIHACGMVIYPDDKKATQWLPIKKQQGLVVTEWEGAEVEEAGFLKEDLLGIQQLDKLADILKLIEKNKGIKLDLYKDIPIDDPKVFEYIAKGFLGDIFHFGARGLSQYCIQMKPESLDEMGICAALYRPGPIENNIHNEYILRKRGESEIDYPVGAEEILRPNLGMMCIEENCLVSTERGNVKIKDVKIGDSVLTNNSFHKVTDVVDKGYKEVFRIKTTFGEDLVCTDDHKVLTDQGWKEIRELEKGSFIKGFWTEKMREVEKKPSLKDWLVGYFVAKGSCGSSPYYTVTNKDKAEKLKALLLEMWPNAIIECSKQDRINEEGVKVGRYRVQVKAKNGHNGYFSNDYIENPLKKLLKEEGIWGLTCYTKHLPKNCSIDTISGIIEGDGCLSQEILVMNNELLIDQIYRKLQEYRIYCCKSRRNDDNISYISYCDIDSKLRFRLDQKPEIKLDRQGFRIPINQIKIDSSYFKTNSERSSWKHSIKLNRPKKIGNLIYRGIEDKVEHLIWGRVLSIEKLDTRHVFDLSIEDEHNFVCGGLLVHNCYQEDIMRMCQKLADFDLETTDGVRKAIGKKVMAKMKSFGEKFISGYVKKYKQEGVTEKEAEALWDQMVEFGKYSFNKCISGRERFYRHSNHSDFRPTIEEMYRIKNDKSYAIATRHKELHSKYKNQGYGTSWVLDKDGRIRKTKIKDISFAGTRQTYKITLEDGKTISTTDNHKFPTQRGKLQLSELIVGQDCLYVNDNFNIGKLVKIVSVGKDRIENVYDVEIDHPEHNFVTEKGIVTCNSHAIAYSRNAYNCLWLKVHYPIEFWSTSFSFADQKDYPRYINEIQRSGDIKILPVDINKSDTVIVSDPKNNSMYWALNSVKQCGDRAQEFLSNEKKENGEFFSLDEFIDRCVKKGSPVNKSVVENLIYAGAFDRLEKVEKSSDRLRLIEFYRENKRVKILEEKDLLTNIQKVNKDKKDWWWSLQQKRVSGFAEFDYQDLVRTYHLYKCNQAQFFDVSEVKYLEENSDQEYCVAVGGYVLEIKERKSKRGLWATVTLESNYEFLNVLIFPEFYEGYKKEIWGSEGNILLIDGYVQWDKWRNEYVLQTTVDSSITVLT